MEKTGKYYVAGEERAKRVSALFSRIAPRYDLINDAQSLGMHRLWKRRLVHLAWIPDGGSALDLCCGTGDLVRSLARAYPRAATIAGLDFTMPMLRIAADRLDRAGLAPNGFPAAGGREGATRARSVPAPAEHGGDHRPGSGGDERAGTRGDERPGRSGGQAAMRGGDPRGGPDVVLFQADALALPFAPASFDRVTIGYGLRNVADVEGCIAEVRRVLRPGGKFLILEFGKPERPLVSRIYFSYLRAAVPVFGRLFFADRDTHGYIYDSLVRFPSQREVADLLTAGGFRTVALHDLMLGIMAIHVAGL